MAGSLQLADTDVVVLGAAWVVLAEPLVAVDACEVPVVVVVVLAGAGVVNSGLLHEAQQATSKFLLETVAPEPQ